jgi:hypothetical protein
MIWELEIGQDVWKDLLPAINACYDWRELESGGRLGTLNAERYARVVSKFHGKLVNGAKS